MSRHKIRLSPMQNEVLRMLEEAGEENLPTVINTVRARFSGSPYSQFMADFSEALSGLLEKDLVRLRAVPQTGSEPSGTFLEWALRFDENIGQWRWNETEAGQERATIEITIDGAEQLRR